MTENARRVLRRNPDPRVLREIAFRSVVARNRIMFSPMCQYSAADGVPGTGVSSISARAVGDAGIVFTGTTHIEPRGRIMPHCPDLWNDVKAEAFTHMVRFIGKQGAVPGIKLGTATK